MTSAPSQLARGYVSALLSAAILSTTAILIRYLTETYHIPALVLAFWRDVFVVLALLPVLAWLRPGLLRVERRHWLYLVAYGLVLSSFNALWTLSVALNGAAVSTVLAYSSAGFTALLGRWLLRERLDWAKLLAVAASLTGCALVSGAVYPEAWRTNVIGILTGVLSGLCFAAYSLMGRSVLQRGMEPWPTLLYTFGFATVFLLLFNLLPGGILPGAAARPADLLWLGDSLAGWSILLLLSFGPTVVGYGLYNVSMVHLPASVANLIITLEPAFTMVTAYFLLGERLSGVQAAGSALILFSVGFMRVYEGRRAVAASVIPKAEPRPVAGDRQ